MEQKELIAYLNKAHRDSPRTAWVREARGVLQARMARTGSPKTRVFSFLGAFAAQMLRQKIFAAGAATLVALVAGSGGMIVLARRALPTSTLYPVKLLVEDVRRGVAFTQEQQADSGLAAAAERMQELTTLSAKHAAINEKAAQAALIARTVKRYADALGESTKTVKKLSAEGKTAVARRTAEKLAETAREYGVLLSTFDSATSSGSILQDAKAVSEEAQEAAGEILRNAIGAQENGASPDEAPEASGAPEASATPSSPPRIPSILPNIVE